ncbi:MAG: hypothetical protein HQL27_09430 [Candidatus Omnitrophica bacterium]|nr:hypothetical protein [Candidatus Omnitrophota bacterium]
MEQREAVTQGKIKEYQAKIKIAVEENELHIN